MNNSKAMMQLDLREIPALYMNLAQDVDKNNKMQKMLKECGFKNIQRVEGCICKGSSIAGCSQAHHKGLSQMSPPFILFEDDCMLNTFRPIIEVPQQADAVYLGIAHFGISNSHGAPLVEYEPVSKDLYRIYNMTSGHSVLYLSEEYVNMCKRIAYHAGYVIKDYQDYGFAEVQRWFNVYAFNEPFFYQTSAWQVTKVFLTDIPPDVLLFCDEYVFLPQAISPRSAALRKDNDRKRLTFTKIDEKRAQRAKIDSRLGITSTERIARVVRTNPLLFVTVRPLVRPLVRFYFRVRHSLFK